MKALLIPIGLVALAAPAMAQFIPPPKQPSSTPPGVVGAQQPAPSSASDDQKRIAKMKEIAADNVLVGKAEKDGVSVRLDAVCHFRGTWSQQLLGVGLITGLAQTGDSQSYTATQIAAANLLKQAGVGVDTTSSNFIAKNIALVTVTCELPPYSAPGQRLDVTVSAMGDASSLRNGTLLYAPLKYPGSDEVYAVASGAISVGGFSAKSGGSSTSKGFVTVGKIPNGAIVQQAVPTNTVFQGKMYLDLETEDVTTAHRIEQKIDESYPELLAHALGGGSIEVTLPAGQSSNSVQAKLMELSVMANTEAKVVIDERSGTIVIGGNVRVGPCAIARGSISVEVSQDFSISQTGSRNKAETTVSGSSSVQANEETAQVAVLRPNTTVADLAEIFQSLKLKAEDIIAILENLRAQGALKAKLELQ